MLVWRGAMMLLAVISCGLPRDRIAEREVATGLAQVTALGPGAQLRLRDIARAEWGQVHVFGPYASSEEIARCLNRATTQLPSGLTHGIHSRDDVNLLVFAFPDGSLESVAVARTSGDFGPEAVQRAYSRAEAVFSVRRAPQGSWGNLVPAGGLTRRCS